MKESKILQGKRVLVVDDEEDVIETLRDLLDICSVDSAGDFESAQKCLEKNHYDCAVFDIMGVNGYALLDMAQAKNIPSIMLTAHALSPDNLVKSIKGGAQVYLPKHKMDEIASYMAEMLDEFQKGVKQGRKWFKRLKPFFSEKFEEGWQERNKQFWVDFDEQFIATKEDARGILK
jgi:CheY-like chemotaxis protein